MRPAILPPQFDCIPLITASILSKKLAEGLDGLVMDIKTGSGAFAADLKMEQNLAKSIVDVSSVNTTAIITDMSQVIGHTAGNALEVKETIDYLTLKKQDPILHELVITLCAHMLVLGKLVTSYTQGVQKVEKVLTSGKAAEVFAQMVSALGGPNDLLENPDRHLIKANVIQPIYPKQTGYITEMNTRMIGLAVIDLGGGRRLASDKINYSVGLSEFCHIGDKIELNQPIAFIHANSQQQADENIKENTRAD